MAIVNEVFNYGKEEKGTFINNNHNNFVHKFYGKF